MNKKLLSAIAGCIFISFFGCDFGSSSSTSKELNPDAGSLSAHSDLPNEYVTESNKDCAGSTIVNSIHMPSDMIRNIRSVQSTRANDDTTITIDSTYRVEGEHSGYAQIKLSGTVSMNMTSQDVKINIAASVIYYDFSSDGKVFIGGEAQCTVNSNYTSTQETMSVTQNGHIKFNGLYTGECKYNMSVVLNADQFTYSGEMNIISDGKEYTYKIDEIR